jgi:hypothetical protein
MDCIVSPVSLVSVTLRNNGLPSDSLLLTGVINPESVLNGKVKYWLPSSKHAGRELIL